MQTCRCMRQIFVSISLRIWGHEALFVHVCTHLQVTNDVLLVLEPYRYARKVVLVYALYMVGVKHMICVNVIKWNVYHIQVLNKQALRNLPSTPC